MNRRALFLLTWLSGALLALSCESLVEDFIGKERILEHWADQSVTGPLAVLGIRGTGLLLLALGHRAREEDATGSSWWRRR